MGDTGVLESRVLVGVRWSSPNLTAKEEEGGGAEE